MILETVLVPSNSYQYKKQTNIAFDKEQMLIWKCIQIYSNAEIIGLEKSVPGAGLVTTLKILSHKGCFFVFVLLISS